MAKVMIVDDSLVMRKNIKSLLEQAGHEIVAEAVNGLQALLDCEKSMPTLITMDISMPGMGGVEAIQKINLAYPGIKIIVISAMAARKVIFEALEAGACNYIIKPITAEKLQKVVEDALKEEHAADKEKIRQKLMLAKNLNEGKTDYLTNEPFKILNKEGKFVFYYKKQMWQNGKESDILEILKGLKWITPLFLEMKFHSENISEEEKGNINFVLDLLKMHDINIQCVWQ